jgi:hypothetical protein
VPRPTVVTGQHPLLYVNQSIDIMSDDPMAILRYLKHVGVNYLMFGGVATNKCVINKSVGLRSIFLITSVVNFTD